MSAVPNPNVTLPPEERSRNHRIIASFLSVVWMGLGQLYNRQYIKGILLAAFEAVAVVYFARNLYHAVWGIATLGEVQRDLVKKVMGDNSIVLLITGLITLIVLVLCLIVYYINIRDAYQNGLRRERGEAAPNFAGSVRYTLENYFPHIMLGIPGIGVVFFTIMPIIFMVLLAFTNFSLPDHIAPGKLVDWVGFQTFRDLLTLKSWSRTFFGVLKWTVIWAVVATVTTYFGGILVALLVQQAGIRFKTMWRTIFIIPYAIPQLISLLVMRNLFNGQFGPINQYLGYFGLGKLPWLTDPTWAKITVIVVNMWVGIPVSMVLIMGILTTIPKELYEAAEVDGATAFQRFRIITLPMILFATAPILITQFAGNINNFNVIFLLTNGDPVNGDYSYAGHTDLLVTWLYKLTLNNARYSMASAIGIIIFIIVAAFSIINYRRTRSFREEDLAE